MMPGFRRYEGTESYTHILSSGGGLEVAELSAWLSACAAGFCVPVLPCGFEESGMAENVGSSRGRLGNKTMLSVVPID